MRNASQDTRIRRALALPVALVPLIGLVPAVASAAPNDPVPTPGTTTTTAKPAPQQPTTTAPKPTVTVPTVPPTATVPTVPPTTPPTVTLPTVPPSTTTPSTTVPPQGPPGRLTVGAVRIVDTSGAGVPGATAFVQGCSGGPGASLGHGGATTVTGQCVRATLDRVPTNWHVLGPSTQTLTTGSGRAEFQFVLERGGIVPPPPPPNHNVRFSLVAQDQDGNGVLSDYAVAECASGRPVGGVRTDSRGNSAGDFQLGCVSVVPTSWPQQCVLLGPHAYAKVVGNGVNHLRFRFRCGPVGPPPPRPDSGGTLIKTDRITGARLAGASFVITPCRTDEAVRAVTTGPDGAGGLSLPAGCYKAIETAAPQGYQLDQTPTLFAVRAGGGFEVTVTDVRVEAGPVVRNPEVRVPIASIPSGRVI